jgi:hypothetical protein
LDTSRQRAAKIANAGAALVLAAVSVAFTRKVKRTGAGALALAWMIFGYRMFNHSLGQLTAK